jgi:hypothetical protein
MGFGLVIQFIQHLYTQIVTTINCSAIANSHTLQFTTTRNESSQFARIFPDCRLVTASSASVFTSSLAGDCLTTNSYSSNSCLKTLVIAAAPRFIDSARTAQKTPLPTVLLLRAVCCGYYLATADVYRAIN